MEFETGRATPCNFNHATGELYVIVHGEDFTITGPDCKLKLMERQLAAKYDIKFEYLGPSSEQKKEIRVLNRTLI